MASEFGDVERGLLGGRILLGGQHRGGPRLRRLGDALGRATHAAAGMALFVTASVLCALAHSLLTLVGARILQGFGGGGLMVLSQAVLAENVARHQLGRAQGFMAAVIVASSTFGPVAGGALTQAFGWPSVFLVNLPLGLLAMVLLVRLPGREGAASAGSSTGRVCSCLPDRWCRSCWRWSNCSASNLRRCSGSGCPWSARAAVAAGAASGTAAVPVDLLRRPAMWRANAMAACSGALLVSEATILPIHLRAVGRGLGRRDLGC